MRKSMTWYLVAAMLVIGITPRAYAGFSPSEAIGLSPAERSSDTMKIQKFLEMKIVGERLKELGFAQEEIQARLHPLSDSQQQMITAINRNASRLQNLIDDVLTMSKIEMGDFETALRPVDLATVVRTAVG